MRSSCRSLLSLWDPRPSYSYFFKGESLGALLPSYRALQLDLALVKEDCLRERNPVKSCYLFRFFVQLIQFELIRLDLVEKADCPHPGSTHSPGISQRPPGQDILKAPAKRGLLLPLFVPSRWDPGRWLCG